MRKFLFLTIFGLSIASWSGDYVNEVTYLVMASMPLVVNAQIDNTDQWTYNNIIAQTFFGGVGVALLLLNFISSRYFWGKMQEDIQADLQKHIEALEENNFQRQQVYNYIERSEEVFKRIINSKELQEQYRNSQ